MASDISLTSSMRSNLFSLQQTAQLMNRTQERLASGKKVNSALDDPSKFFSAQNHQSRASDLERLKAGMGEAIQTIKAADKGISGVNSLLEQARGLADSARSSDSAGKSTIASQFNTLISQMKDLVDDADYKGVNLLASQNLTVAFEGDHNLAVTGINGSGDTYLNAVGNATDDAANGGYNNFGTEADIANAVSDLDTVISAFRAQASTLAANISIVTTRQDFTQGMIDTLRTGADQLTEADSNEEGANMLMLQTRQQLATVSLQLASQASQSILRLF